MTNKKSRFAGIAEIRSKLATEPEAEPGKPAGKTGRPRGETRIRKRPRRGRVDSMRHEGVRLLR